MIEFIIVSIVIIIIISNIPGVGNALDELNSKQKKLLNEWENEKQNDQYKNSEEYKKYTRRLEHSIKKIEIQIEQDKRLAAEFYDSEAIFTRVPDINKKNYLQSDKWNQIRKAVLERDNYICRKCNASGVPLDVHHLHYRTLGNESLEDLVAICRPCHNEIHLLHGYNPYYTYPLNEYDIYNAHKKDNIPF